MPGSKNCMVNAGKANETTETAKQGFMHLPKYNRISMSIIPLRLIRNTMLRARKNIVQITYDNQIGAPRR